MTRNLRHTETPEGLGAECCEALVQEGGDCLGPERTPDGSSMEKYQTGADNLFKLQSPWSEEL
eukprot:2797712-Rhodomonas_salina.2